MIGMGAVVTRDVPTDTVVVGNPAKPCHEKPHEDLVIKAHMGGNEIEFINRHRQ